jgi:ferredoxin, 2Fe-2S
VGDLFKPPLFSRPPLHHRRQHGRNPGVRGKVAKLTIVNRAGEEAVVDGATGHSVMEIIRENGFDELLALCGGCCSCATCHVHVDQDFVGKLPPMSEDENDLLDSSEHRNERSRLSCQIQFSEELEGLRVQIAPED